jgi:hypothetical protein
MASPTIRFKRGQVSNLPGFLAGEPGFTTDKYDFYIGLDGTTPNNKFFGSARYWEKETGSSSAVLKLISSGESGSINLKTRNDHTGITTYTFPAQAPAGTGHFLTADSSGNLSWDSVSASATFTDSNLAGVTTFVDLRGGNISAGLVTATDYYVGVTTILSTVGGLITLSGIGTIDQTTKNTLETILSLDPNDFASLNVTGIATIGQLLDANGGLDVLGHSELDDLNVSGIATISSDFYANGNVSLGNSTTDTLTVGGLATFNQLITGAISGNAGTATSLANGRNIAVSGIVTGTAYFDGTEDISIATIIQNNVIGLGTHTYGDYVASITSGDGLSGGVSGSQSTPTLSVNVGAGITISSDNVAFKNAGSLSDNKLMKWDDTNEQLVDTIITDNGSTATVGGGLVVTGDLTVNGTTTQINTTELAVYDRTITLGIQTGSTPADTTWDLGILMNYGNAGVASTAGVIWEFGTARFQFAANSNNPAVGIDTTTPNITVSAFAPIEIGQLWVTDCAGTSQVISCNGTERFLENITVDAGTWV